MSRSFRGFIASIKKRVSCPEPRLDGLTFTTRVSSCPSSSEYTLEGVMAAGTPISPVNTEVLHDASAVSNLVNQSVESSNNNE